MKFRSIASVLALAVCSCFTFAQTAPAPATVPGLGITSSASVIVLNGQKIPAVDLTGTLPFINSKSLGMFYFEYHMISSTDSSFNANLGGGKWTPKIDGLLSKTLLSPNTFQVSLSAAPGFVRNAAGRSALGGIGCANIDFDPSSQGHFVANLFRGCYVNASGFGPKPSGYVWSSGVGFSFGGGAK